MNEKKNILTGLYLVPTPIGNLSDITLRAIETLKKMDYILAEDTRVTSKLLKFYDINVKMRSFNLNNEHKLVPKILSEFDKYSKIALVSDAGSPSISDPGFLIVRECVKNNITVHALPGPTALIPAISLSGLPANRFVFEGFLPHKKGRQKRVDELIEEKRTIVIYEAPHRLIKTLSELSNALGDSRKISVSREISKIYEETLRGSFKDVISHFNKTKPKGEFVIVIKGK